MDETPLSCGIIGKDRELSREVTCYYLEKDGQVLKPIKTLNSRSVLVICTVSVTKQYSVNISFLKKKLAQRTIEVQSVVSS